MKNNNLRMTRLGIEEKEDDALQDILHPDADEKNMEAVEKSFKQMMDMQKRGSDIYFGGFSQMKRFPFFNEMCNWFMPYHKEHPALAKIYEKAKATKVLDALLANGPFCDSDKYSLAIALDSLIDNIPANMREVIESGQASPMAEAVLEQNSAAFIRRMYLQNLYRFFRLHYDRAEFTDIFNVNVAGYGFFMGRISPYLYMEKSKASLMGLSRFLIKHGDYVHADEVLDMIYSEGDAEFMKLHIAVMLHFGHYDEAIKDVETVIDDTDDERLLNMAAEVYFKAGKPTVAAELYQRLREINPDSKKYMFNSAASLVEGGEIKKALPLLAELDFKYPDDVFVMRTRAWAFLRQGKGVEAEALYNRILKTDRVSSDDYLNAGYALWFQNKIDEAVIMMRNYLIKSGGKVDLIDIFDRDSFILEENKVRKAEVYLMVDLVED
jgi:predicted Zn-dependent protease